MTIYSALNTHLRADVGVAAIVGTQVYPGIPPERSVAPFISFRRIAYENVRHLGGLSGLAKHKMQIDCWGATSLDSISVSEAVRDAVDHFRGPMGTEALEIRLAILDTQNDDPERPTDAAENDIHRNRVDVEFWAAETI